MTPYSLYLHIPFCRHRCAYCDFNTYAGLNSLMGDYVRALCCEIEQAGENARAAYAVETTVRSPARSGDFPFYAGGEGCVPAHTIFFGGGTPSLLPLSELEQIMATLRAEFALIHDAEITLEANPGTVSLEYLRGLRALGINRLSMGMQSADPNDLRILEREHDFFDVIHAVQWARQAGFENINLDLIFGLPYQSLTSWQRTLELALGLQPDHLSVYSLILEHGTPMNAWVAHGLLPMPDDDLAASMYEWAMDSLPEAGFEQYEISNWARRDARGQLIACRHNLQYWHNEPYLGLGAGAHGYARGRRTANVRAPRAYIARFLGQGRDGKGQREFPRTNATVNAPKIDRQAEMRETMMVGLRLVDEGVSIQTFETRFGETLEAVFGREIQGLVKAGLLEQVEGRVRLTRRGRMLGNQVFMQFV